MISLSYSSSLSARGFSWVCLAKRSKGFDCNLTGLPLPLEELDTSKTRSKVLYITLSRIFALIMQIVRMCPYSFQTYFVRFSKFEHAQKNWANQKRREEWKAKRRINSFGDENSLQIGRLHLGEVAWASRVENELVWDKGMIYERKRKEINAFAARDEPKDTKGGEKLFRFFISLSLVLSGLKWKLS